MGVWNPRIVDPGLVKEEYVDLAVNNPEKDDTKVDNPRIDDLVMVMVMMKLIIKLLITRKYFKIFLLKIFFEYLESKYFNFFLNF